MKFFLIVFLLLFVLKPKNCTTVLPKCAAWRSDGNTITGNFAGTQGNQNSELNTPYGFYYGKDNYISIADTKNNRIIGLSIGDRPNRIGEGKGVGESQSNKPTSVYLDKYNDYYIGDSENAPVLRWNFTSPVSYVTVAGKLGEFNNTNDTFGGGFLGVYVDENEALYVSDSSNHHVMYFPRNQSQGIRIAGTGRAGSAATELDHPMFIYLDANKTLFIADTKNQRIQKWEQNAIAGTTVADSSPPLSLRDPRSLTMDSEGNMYIVDNALSQVLKWNPSLNKSSCIIGCSQTNGSRADQLNQPNFLSFDANKNLIVSDTGNNRIQLFSFYIDQNCLHSTTKCRPPNVTITPEHPLYIDTPDVQIERDQPIEYSISIKLDCDSITSINRNWSIFSCNKKLGRECTLDQVTSTLLGQNTSDIYISPYSLDTGYYRIECHVTIVPHGLDGLALSFLHLVSPRAKLYFVQNQLLQITVPRTQLLILEPGRYSLNVQELGEYDSRSYYCRIYPNVAYLLDNNGAAVQIGDEQTTDSSYPQCLSPDGFNLSDTETEYSLTIYPNKLRAEETYEFRLDLLDEISGQILVHVIDSPWSFSIGIKCALHTCSIADEYYQTIADTDTILYSFCLNNCSIEDYTIEWQVSGGKKFFDNNSIDWSVFQFSEQGHGLLYQNFTIQRAWFRRYPYVQFLLIKVFYRSSTENGYGMSWMKIRPIFFEEICSIAPPNGTTKTLFHVECYAEEQRDYTLIVRSSNVSLSTFRTSTFDVYLPMGDWKNDFRLDLIVDIRDQFQSSQQFYLPIIHVMPDIESTRDLIANASIAIQGNRNEISQYLTSISSILNYLNFNDLEQLMNSGSDVDLAEIFISSLDQTRFVPSPKKTSSCSLENYRSNFNQRSIIRERLISLYLSQSSQTIPALLLVCSTLNQLTNNPTELLQSSLIEVSKKCYQMSEVLHSIASSTTKEQVANLVNQLTQCVSNTLTGANGVLLQRSIAVDEDYSDWYTSAEKQSYFTKELVNNRIVDMVENASMQTMHLLTEVLSKHINTNEEIEIDNSKASLRFSKKKNLFLQNRTDYSAYRTWRTPLSPHGLNDQYLKHSTTFSVTVYDQDRNEAKFYDESDYLIEFTIPRDVNMKQLAFRNEDLLARNQSIVFNYHQIPLIAAQSNFTYSFHLEFQPMNSNLSYFLIYKLNHFPKWNQSTDGHVFFCSQNLPDYHSLFLNNLSSRKEKFIVIGIRELDANETCSADSTVHLQPRIFSANYQYRYYSSACFYRDENKRWRTDGLIIGNQTNMTHTHCFSHRL